MNRAMRILALEPSCSSRSLFAPPLLSRQPLQRLATSRRLRRQTATSASLPELDLPTSLFASDHAAWQPDTEAVLRHSLSLGDATIAAAGAADTAVATAGQPADNGWLTPLVDSLEFVLGYIQTGLDGVHTPYSYGWSIVALVALVKLATFPLTKKQVESMLSMQTLKPKIDAIKAKYGDDKNAVSRETSALYEKAKVNPLAGCLPSIATVPIFIGLYRSLSDVTTTGQLDNQGFFWIPSLAGPTSIAAQRAGAGTAWLFPFVDGAPPVGWDLASRYLALPIALVIAQYVSSAIITPPIDPNAENANVQKTIYYALPVMVCWFALNVPSGLSLYYFSNTVLTGAMQVYLRKLGGAKSAEFDLGPIELGKARRTGVLASSADEASTDRDAAAVQSNGNGASMAPDASPFATGEQNGAVAEMAAVESEAAIAAPKPINRRCKRKRRELLTGT